MPFKDLRGRWLDRLSHIDAMLDPLIVQWPDHNRIALPSMLHGLQNMLGTYLEGARAEPGDGTVGDIVGPAQSALDEFVGLASVSGGAELLERITIVRDAARTASLALADDDGPWGETVDDVIAAFAEEYRMSLILALTANFALTQKVTAWQDSKQQRRGAEVGDHLDLTTMEFTADESGRTIPMASLTSASTGEPTVMTPANIGAAIREMMTGGTPPAIYRMAYTQWFTTIHAAWEDAYRARLAAAHGPAPDGKAWGKNDIRSEFFNEVRLIRNDIAHKNGICSDSAGNTVIGFVRQGEPIAPTPRDMLGMLDLFPDTELRIAPTRTERTTSQLPFQFDNDWVQDLVAHVAAIQPAKKKRAAVVQAALEEWMKGPAGE